MTRSGSPVAVITGAGRGIGRSIALTQAAKGYDVLGTWVRDEAAAESLRKEVETEHGRRCVMHRCDLADPEQAATLVAAASAEFGRVDALVHSAGIASRGRFVADTTPDEIHRVVSVHALGAFYLCSALAPLLRTRGNGRIVLMSSIATSNPAAGGAPYMMAKAALEALGQTLALEEASHGTRVNVVAPGLVSTVMGDRLAQTLTGVERPQISTRRCRLAGSHGPRMSPNSSPIYCRMGPARSPGSESRYMAASPLCHCEHSPVSPSREHDGQPESHRRADSALGAAWCNPHSHTESTRIPKCAEYPVDRSVAGRIGSGRHRRAC